MEEKCLAPSAYEAQRSRGTYKNSLTINYTYKKYFPDKKNQSHTIGLSYE